MHHYYDVHAYRLCHACTKFYDRKHLAMGVGEQQDHKTPDQWWWVRGDRSWKFEPQSAHRGSWDDPSEWWRLPGPHACSEIFSLDTCSIFLIMQIWSLGQWHIYACRIPLPLCLIVLKMLWRLARGVVNPQWLHCRMFRHWSLKCMHAWGECFTCTWCMHVFFCRRHPCQFCQGQKAQLKKLLFLHAPKRWVLSRSFQVSWRFLGESWMEDLRFRTLYFACMHACLVHDAIAYVAYFPKHAQHVAFEWQGQAGAIQGYKCPCQGVRTLSMHACI